MLKKLNPYLFVYGIVIAIEVEAVTLSSALAPWAIGGISICALGIIVRIIEAAIDYYIKQSSKGEVPQ